MTSTPPKKPSASWLLLWERLAVPAWGIGPDRTIRFLNPKAEKLLGVTSAACIGRPCHEVVAGLNAEDGPFCCQECPMFQAVEDGDELEPAMLRVGDRNESGRWIQVLPIVLMAPDGSGPFVVESAVDVDRWARIEGYVKKIAARELPGFVGAGQRLTGRESEVLSLLALDLMQREIADRLHVSYTTVRTHVQRILAKLGVRSIQAAIAQHLLKDTPDD